MSKVIILPENLANQIAAGEIVERPAAVVKELVENAIDAHSRRIRVEVRRAGKSEIKVVDNGSGMTRDDALLAFERHATSKIKTAEDLKNVSTLGFRGEALPSIAAVSRLQLVTRTEESDSGTQIKLDGGVLRDVRDTGCPSGTTIIVQNLFFNTPARRKFMRTNQTEMSHISEQVIRLALAQPDIQFRLYHEKRLIQDLPVTDNVLSRAAQIFGRRLLDGGQSLQYTKGGIELSGFLSPPEMQRPTTHGIYTFVNKRYVRDTLLNRTISRCYQGLIPKERYPVAFLSILLSPELVDVNVHPTKSEVRFRDISLVLETVRQGVLDALRKLQKRAWNRPIVEPKQATVGVPTWNEPNAGYFVPVENPRTTLQEKPCSGKDINSKIPREVQTTFEKQSLFSSLRVIGQLGDSYILCEAPDGLVIIDQHAAHERILFDVLVEKPDHEKEPSQVLFNPLPLELLPKEAKILGQLLPMLKEMGIYVEAFGGNTFIIKAIPVILGRENAAQLIKDVVDEASELNWVSEKPAVGIKLKQSMACRAAVKANHRITNEEAAELLKKLDQTQNPSTCPHGRPLWWKITHDQIARFFKRSQSPVGN